jgi:hypothetical protein
MLIDLEEGAHAFCVSIFGGVEHLRAIWQINPELGLTLCETCRSSSFLDWRSNSEDDYDNIDGDHRTQREVWDDELIVSLPGTIYAVTYYKPANSPSLLAKNFPSQDDSRADLTQAEFLSRAWHLANTKARELGWLA